MQTPIMDRFVTVIRAPSIEAYLERYRQAGFALRTSTIAHDPGLRIGFVDLGAEWLEFVWVAEEAVFASAMAESAAARSGVPTLQTFHAAGPRPMRIGLIADDVAAIHGALVPRGYTLPSPDPDPRTHEDSEPCHAVLSVPEALLPGAQCFVVRSPPRQIEVAPNTTYAVCGVTFVTATPAVSATRWRDVLAPNGRIEHSTGGWSVEIGTKRANWISPEHYGAYFGRPWLPASHPFGEIGVLHILAQDLDTVQRMVTYAGWHTTELDGGIAGRPALVIAPDAHLDCTLVVTEQPVAA